LKLRKEYQALEQAMEQEAAQKYAKIEQERDKAVSELEQLKADVEPLLPYVELFKQHTISERRFPISGEELNAKLLWIALQHYPNMSAQLRNNQSRRLPVYQLMQDLMTYCLQHITYRLIQAMRLVGKHLYQRK
jgi:hypothetical protein